ncbi:hypothetical protein LZ32DRAFT_425949 [Colletotrichum eremochloae]|nr:hypothetical protein LZ32DRAFT_425949 [Colletotrichum eremochloae]
MSCVGFDLNDARKWKKCNVASPGLRLVMIYSHHQTNLQAAVAQAWSFLYMHPTAPSGSTTAWGVHLRDDPPGKRPNAEPRSQNSKRSCGPNDVAVRGTDATGDDPETLPR